MGHLACDSEIPSAPSPAPDGGLADVGSVSPDVGADAQLPDAEGGADAQWPLAQDSGTAADAEEPADGGTGPVDASSGSDAESSQDSGLASDVGERADGGAEAVGDAGTVEAPCTTDAACRAGASCQVVLSSDQSDLELRCAPLVGAVASGGSCTDGAECKSGLCLDGFCSSPCLGAGDCTPAAHCEPRPVTIGSLTESFSLCLVAPCASSQGCDPGEICSDVRQGGGGVESFCRRPHAGGSALGEACQSSATCESLLCPYFQVCSEVCSSDLDCSGIASGICVDTFFSSSSVVQACAVGCSRSADCPLGACVFASDSVGDRVRFTCAPPHGADATGADCSTANHCAAGMCLSNYFNGQKVDSICTQPCITAADCPAGYGVCADVTVSHSSGGTQIIQLCNHP
ncbi:MAG: hypothetical protein HY901_29570 [Deltaproteobacteria bacterium]|nr:hypothetical protein [Deltaproteobacteria bacterium]